MTASTLPVDPEIADLCTDASDELTAMAWAAARYGCTLPEALEMFRAHAVLIEDANSCGYLATASRGRRARHAAYEARLKTPDRQRVNSDEQIKARARRWGHAA